MLYALLVAVVTGLFSANVIRDYLAKRKMYHGLWSAALVMSCIAALCYAVAAVSGSAIALRFTTSSERCSWPRIPEWGACSSSCRRGLRDEFSGGCTSFRSPGSSCCSPQALTGSPCKSFRFVGVEGY